MMQAPPAKAVKVVEPQKEKRLPAAKRRQIEARQDADDFAAEYRMLKKVKKGKMSEVRISVVRPPALLYTALALGFLCTLALACEPHCSPQHAMSASMHACMWGDTKTWRAANTMAPP